MTFVLIHGSFTSHDQLEKFWLPRLNESVSEHGRQVLLPQFPTDDKDTVIAQGPTALTNQTLQSWLESFDKFYPQIADKDDLIFVCHSLGPLFALHVLQQYDIKLNAAIFICPFLTHLAKSPWQVNHVNQSFYKDDFDFDLLKAKVPFSYVVYSTNDPYVETSQSLTFAEKMNSTIIPVVDGGHLNKAENAGFIIELCKTRVPST